MQEQNKQLLGRARCGDGPTGGRRRLAVQRCGRCMRVTGRPGGLLQAGSHCPGLLDSPFFPQKEDVIV